MQFKLICAEALTSANTMGTGTVEGTADMGYFCEKIRQRRKEGLQSTKRPSTFRDEVTLRSPSISMHSTCMGSMHVVERDFDVSHATCGSTQQDALTTAQSRFLATTPVNVTLGGYAFGNTCIWLQKELNGKVSGVG